MSYFKTVILIIMTHILVSACSDAKTEKLMLAEKYWQALEQNDIAMLTQVLADPSRADVYASSEGFSLSSSNYSLVATDDGVNAVFHRYCYDDLIVPIVFVERDGHTKIDDATTQKQQFKAFMLAKKNKEFCYDFDATTLSGVLNGKPWSFVKHASRIIDWGDKKTRSISLYGEECDTEYAGQCQQPSLIISALDLAGAGNLSYQKTVTIHMPPHDNFVVTEGSYRASQEGERIKLELTINQNPENKVSGVVYLTDIPTL